MRPTDPVPVQVMEDPADILSIYAPSDEEIDSADADTEADLRRQLESAQQTIAELQAVSVLDDYETSAAINEIFRLLDKDMLSTSPVFFL